MSIISVNDLLFIAFQYLVKDRSCQCIFPGQLRGLWEEM